MGLTAASEYWVESDEKPSDAFDRLLRGANELHSGRAYYLKIDVDNNVGRVRFSLEEHPNESAWSPSVRRE